MRIENWGGKIVHVTDTDTACEICGDVVERPVLAERCKHVVRLCEACKRQCSAALRLCLRCEDGGAR